MAPMEPAKADAALTKEALEEAVSGLGEKELQEMGARLTRSAAGMEEMLEELEAERQALREEKEYLNDTITLFMKEMQKLNIGKDNTVEPTLVDGAPLAFVGRFWEKVKPRDTAYAINEHVGEIKKPEPGQQATPTPQEVARQVGQNTVQNLRGALGPIWQRAETLVKDTHDRVQTKVQERAAAREAELAKQRSAAKGSKEPRASKKRAPKQPAAEGAGEPADRAAADPEEAKADPQASGGSASSGAVATDGAGAATPAEAAPAAAGAAEEQDAESSTVLIEALLKIDDGSVQTLRVRAADRCKEVARRFVQEHSLKAWFEDPLTAWLKKVEAEAERFPVTIEGDLMEIRKTHSRAK